MDFGRFLSPSEISGDGLQVSDILRRAAVGLADLDDDGWCSVWASPDH